ncbi:MAG: Flagellar hook-associated protein 2 [bacterium ADurb.Bin429]|nr:MAG: Flagellar hook-associated protein 2 [bacterium ADurb.Bin429]
MAAASTESTITASAGASAVAGQYTVTVDALATNHQLISQAYTDQDTTSIGSGTYTIAVNGTTTEIAVNELTLTGLRDAINGSGADVSAFIVENDGAYHLVLSAKTAGTDGAITVTPVLAGGTAPAMVELQAAADTRVTLGSGANAITLTRDGTTLTDVIPGITLTLSSASVGKTATITVSGSNADVRTGVSAFVTQVNAFLDAVTQLSSYNADTGETGVLFGNSRLQQIKGELLTTITAQVGGLATGMNSAVQVGIRLGTDGKLAYDNTVLEAAVNEDRERVVRLFSTMGIATSPYVSYLSSTSETQVSDAAGYTVQTTQAADRARLTIAGGELPETLADDETLTLNNQTVTLTAGMTRSQVIAAINATSADSRITATLTGADGTGTGNYLTLTQADYGATEYVKAVSTLAAGGTGIGTTLVTAGNPGAGNVGRVGKDVVGTINGQAATGVGQVLTGSEGAAKGLMLQVSATAPGDLGTVTFTRGVGGVIDRLLEYVTRAGDGAISNVQTTLDANILSLDDAITRGEASVTREVARLRMQFNAMETALSTYKNQSSQLANLIAGLPTYSLG